MNLSLACRTEIETFGPAIPPALESLFEALIGGERGSHVKMVKDGKVSEIPVHGNHDLGIGLIKAIEKQTGEKLL